MAGNRHYFPFVQFEFAHSLGLAAGRYLMQPPDPAAGGVPAPAAAVPASVAAGSAGAGAGAGAGADGPGGPSPEAAARPIERGAGDQRLLGSADVLVVRVRGGKAASGGFLRRGQKEQDAGEEPAEVPLTIATLVRGRQMLSDRMAADQLVRGMEPAERERWVREGIADLNRAVGVYRVCAADPYVFDVSRADPRAVRIGYGFSEEVFAGSWTRSVLVDAPPAPKLSRHLQLAPSEGTAAVLAGQGTTMESEELVLRVLLDLDQGRLRAAAVGLKGALDLLLHELAGQVISGRVRLLVDAITELQEPVATLALRACRKPLGEAEAKEMAEYAEQMGATIDRWRYEPRGY